MLDEWNPMVLEERFPSLKDDDSIIRTEKPTWVWLYGNCDAFYTLHLLRTSGFDRRIQENCASSSVFGSDFENSVFVGEDTGALCIDVSMDSAKASGNDPKGAPEFVQKTSPEISTDRAISGPEMGTEIGQNCPKIGSTIHNFGVHFLIPFLLGFVAL